MRAPVYTARRIAVLADVRYILRISIRNIIHVCRIPRYIFTTLSPSYSPSYVYTIYIYKTAELTRERGGQRENRINPSNERERERIDFARDFKDWEDKEEERAWLSREERGKKKEDEEFSR